MLENLAFSAALITLGIASISDLRTREVPDWLSYGAIFFGFGLRVLDSIISSSWTSLISGILGFTVFVFLALIMFYTGQWGGGDSKLLIGMGVLIGLPLGFSQIPMLLIFWVNSLLAGAVYGLLYSFWLAFLHRKQFFPVLTKNLKSNRKLKILLIVLSICVLILLKFVTDFRVKTTILFMPIILLFTFYIWLFVKSIEESVMIKNIPLKKLTEGDWIVNDVIIDGKKICGPKDLGIDKKQINKLIKLSHQGKIKTIKIKEGIPFVPSFFFAMILTIIVGDWSIFLF